MRREESVSKQFNYKSVHEYLDALFNGKQPSEDEIIQAKKAYRKLYLKHYLKHYSQQHIQISFRLTKQQYKDLKMKAEKQELKPSYFVRQLVISGNKVNTAELRIVIREIIDEIDESLFKGTQLNPESLLQKLNHLEEIL